MKLNIKSIKNSNEWENTGIKLPQYDVETMANKTIKSPIWLHFGAGNIFRAFPAALQQQLLNKKLSDKGIIVIETYDKGIIEKIYTPFDNLTLNVTLDDNPSKSGEIIASVAKALFVPHSSSNAFEEISLYFRNPSLQLVSFTITEKGYAVSDSFGKLFKALKNEISNGLKGNTHIISIVTAALFTRYQKGKYPIALLSMDNCAKNGDILKNSVMSVAYKWHNDGFVDKGFLDYLSDENTVSFPWSMVDKITPRPAKEIEQLLSQKGIESMSPIVTEKNTYIAPFVNAEKPQYLVIEDNFPNGRPPLEETGVFFTDRQTVEKTEKMKVTTCLNPLHTAMSIYGCLQGYSFIYEIMEDPNIVKLIRCLGYYEGLPVVSDPKIISPKFFIDEVLNVRLTNKFVPDTPQRIVTDTSQKLGIRFSETVKSYILEEKDVNSLIAIPLTIAGWCRYLLGVDDSGRIFELSPDPLKTELTTQLAGVIWDNPSSYTNQLIGILSNTDIFKIDLTKTALGRKIESFFIDMLRGKGAVQKTLADAMNN